MIGIILAAGKGTRLGEMGQDKPKGLIDLGGICPLIWTLERFQEVGIQPVLVVVGYQGDSVRDCLHAHFSHKFLHFVYNGDFADTDSACSFSLAARLAEMPLIMTYGDTLVTRSLLQRVLQASSPNVLAVDRRRPRSKIDMKIRVQDSRVIDIGKGLPGNQADGESACLFKFDICAKNLLLNQYAQRVTQGQKALGFEIVLRECLSGFELSVVDCETHDWCEIDQPNDIDIAREFVQFVR